MAVDGRSLIADKMGAFNRGAQSANILKNQRLQSDLTQQQLAQGQQQQQQANQFNKLSGNLLSGQFEGGQNRQQVINEMIANNPDKAQAILKSVGIQNQQGADEASSFAYTLQNTPPELRGDLIKAVLMT